jgi:hypothetical protein
LRSVPGRAWLANVSLLAGELWHDGLRNRPGIGPAMLDRTLSFRTNDIVLTADLAVAGAVFYFLRVSVGYGYDKKHGFNRDESSVAARHGGRV